MAGINIGIGGAWKNMANLSIGVGGVWKQVQKVSIGVGGVWKDVWQNLAVACADLSANRLTISPANAQATITILNDGTWSSTTVGGGTNTGTWLTAGTVAQVEVYLTGSGDALSSGTLDTWLSCSTTRSWTLTNSADGVSTKTWTGTMTFRDATTLATLDTAAISIEASVDM